MTRFGRALRADGLLVGPSEISDALVSLGLVDLMDRRSVYRALRSVLVSRQPEIALFDRLFDRFWELRPHLPDRPSPGRRGSAAAARRLRPLSGEGPVPGHDPDAEDILVQPMRMGASANRVAGRRDLTILGSDELSELSAIASRIVRALSSKAGRRRRPHPRKGTPDLRAALRVNLGSGGEPIRLPRRRRVPRVPRLLAVLDVSGSMDRHAKLLLQLLYAMDRMTSQVESFVFSTSLTRITRMLRAPSYTEALERVGRAVDHWSGGTRIGESLATLNSAHGHLQTRYTTVFLLSDGWETGDPEALAREVGRMRRRVRRVVWLNPLLGTEGYEPLARGLRAVEPFVDHAVSAMDLDHLRVLPNLLRA